MVEFDSSVYRGEAPIYGGPVLVALTLQYLDMGFQGTKYSLSPTYFLSKAREKNYRQ